MIGELLKIITREVTDYIDKQIQLPSGQKSVILQKPTNSKGELEIPDNTISVSLLSIEEELSTRDAMIKKQVIDGKVYRQNPAVNINLQIIFIANFQNDYINELNSVTKILEFFQKRPSFLPEDTKGLDKLKIDKLVFKLNTLELDEQHNIWNLLGCKYMPSIVYKVGMITIQEEKQLSKDKIVKEVDIQTEIK